MKGVEILLAIRKKTRALSCSETAWVPLSHSGIQEELRDLSKLGFVRWGIVMNEEVARLTEEGLTYLRTHL